MVTQKRIPSMCEWTAMTHVSLKIGSHSPLVDNQTCVGRHAVFNNLKVTTLNASPPAQPCTQDISLYENVQCGKPRSHSPTHPHSPTHTHRHTHTHPPTHTHTHTHTTHTHTHTHRHTHTLDLGLDFGDGTIDLSVSALI
jgi:hypothetical protein